MERKKKSKEIVKKLKKPFRLIILNENSFEERFSYSLTPMNLIVMLGGFLVVFANPANAFSCFYWFTTLFQQNS